MEFLTILDVLNKLKISKSFLYTLRREDKDFPHPVRLSSNRKLVFDKNEIEAWMIDKLNSHKDIDIIEGVLS